MALPQGVTGIIIDNKSGDFRMSVSGFDSPDMHYKWLQEDIQEGDEIEITFEDIDESLISACKVVDWTKPEERAAYRLAQYHEEKRKLKEMGLL